MSLEVLRYAAFTTDPAGGNPAGVVIADALPSDAEMQAVAAEVGYSETAFLAPRPDGALDVRYLSPAAEVPFCGHATIAAGVALADRDPGLELVTVVTRTATVPVAVDRADGRVSATLTSPPARSAPLPDDLLDEVLRPFGWDRAVLADDLAPVVGHGGADHPLLFLRTREHLAAMSYDFPRLRALMERESWTTVALLWRESDDRVHARNAFAVGGVVEDPATGAAAAALGGHLREVAALPASGRFTVLQGDDMGRPSVLAVDALAATPSVRVGGPAVPMPT